MQQVSLGGALKNDMWITEDDAPDPSPLPTLPGFHVLVRPVINIVTETNERPHIVREELTEKESAQHQLQQNQMSKHMDHRPEEFVPQF